MDMVHGSSTDGATWSTVDRSSVGTGTAVAHGWRAANRARGLFSGAGKGE
jgi:hypothetical protein